jgi:hypothetical protein
VLQGLVRVCAGLREAERQGAAQATHGGSLKIIEEWQLHLPASSSAGETGTTTMLTERVAAVIHAAIELAVDRSWLRRSLRHYSDCRLRSTSFDWIRREARLMPAMPREPPHAPERDFAVWELRCRSIVRFGWDGERNASGRDLRGAE